MGRVRRTTELDRLKICEFRTEGRSYDEIAKSLGISKKDVEAFCRRHRIGGTPLEYELNILAGIQNGTRCRNCGLPIKTPGKNKRFCSERCRHRYWYRRHYGNLKGKTEEELNRDLSRLRDSGEIEIRISRWVSGGVDSDE